MNSIYSVINEQEYELYASSLHKIKMTTPKDEFFEIDFDKENETISLDDVNSSIRSKYYDENIKRKEKETQFRQDQITQIEEILSNMRNVVFVLVSMAHLVEKTDPFLSKQIYQLQEKIQNINYKIEENKSNLKLYQVKKEYGDVVAIIPTAFKESDKLSLWKKIVVDIAKALGLKPSTAEALESQTNFVSWQVTRNAKERLAEVVTQALTPQKRQKLEEPLHFKDLETAH